MNILDKTIVELVEMIKSKQITSYEVVSEYIKKIENIDDKIGAFLVYNKEKALDAAKVVDEKIKNGEAVGKLAGVPFGLKDNMQAVGYKMTCASKMLENYESIFDATVYEKLKDEDAVLIGKLNMDEFAMGSSNETSYFKNVNNPWDLERVAGGSSGGSAAAVAAGELLFSLGSDTGGSIRQPASLCGIVGMKPTYGRVSRYGVAAFGSSLDQIGPFTKNVEDNMLILSIISGKDEKDTTSYPLEKVEFGKGLKDGVSGLKIAIPKQFYAAGIHEDILNKLNEVKEKYKALGAIVEEVEMPMSKYALPAYYIISSAEASSNLSRYDGIRYGHISDKYEDLDGLYEKSRSEGFGEEVKRRIMLGTYVLSSGYYDAYYKKGLEVRSLIKKEFEDMFEKYDIILTPTVPNTAFKTGEKTDNALEMYMEDICTVPISIAGVPAISMNCGFDKLGLPIGMQLVGNYFDEETIYKAAYAMEKELNITEKAEVK